LRTGTWTETKEIKVEYYGEVYNVKVDVTFSAVPDYGADADGNRGVCQKFIDEVVILQVRNDETGEVLDFPISDDLRDIIDNYIFK
jgi:hypothetical protein